MASARQPVMRLVCAACLAAGVGAVAVWAAEAPSPAPATVPAVATAAAAPAPAPVPATAAAPQDASAPATSSVPAAASADASAAAAPAAPAGPATHVVARGALSLKIQGEGTFLPIDGHEIRPRLSAHAGPLVITAAAGHGSLVQAGDVVLEFDSGLIKSEITAADAELAAAKALLTRAEADLALGTAADARAMRIGEQELSNAEASLKWWNEVDGPQMLQNAELQVRIAKASVDDQDDELEQLRKMYKSEELTSATADIVVRRAVRALEMSRIHLKMWEGRAEKVKTHAYPIARQEMLDQVEGVRQKLAMLKVAQAQAAVLRKNALITAQLGHAAAERKLAELNKDLGSFSFKAPADGLVYYGQGGDSTWQGADPRTLRVGEKILPGAVVMTVYAPGKLQLKMPVPESQCAWVAAGTRARLTPIAYSDLAYEGSCDAPTTVAKTPAGLGFELTVKVPQLDGRLQPGMKATVHIDAGDVGGVLITPVAAVSGGKVWRKDKEGRETEVSVATGRSDGKMIEIRSGLSEGDEILAQYKR